MMRTIILFMLFSFVTVGLQGEGRKEKKCPCGSFGMFYKKIFVTNLLTLTRIPILMDTVGFNTKEVSLDVTTGRITLKKPGFWLLHYSATVSNELAEPTQFDLFVHLNNQGDVLGSGRPLSLFPMQYKKITSSIVVKAIDSCTHVSLILLNPEKRPSSLVNFAVIADFDAIYLGPLNCVCDH